MQPSTAASATAKDAKDGAAKSSSKKVAAAKPAKKSVAKATKPAAKKAQPVARSTTAEKKAKSEKSAKAAKPAAKVASAKAAPAKKTAAAKTAKTSAKTASAKTTVAKTKTASAKSASRQGGVAKAVAVRPAKASRAATRVARATRRAPARRPAMKRPQFPLPDTVDDYEVLTIAARHLGTPYRFGGSSSNGIDCSGFTRIVFSEVGLDLPHSAQGQFGMGERIERFELQPGDLVFFRTVRRGPSHVGIYLGDDLFIHAASRGRMVRVDTLDDSYYRARFLGGRRLRVA